MNPLQSLSGWKVWLLAVCLFAFIRTGWSLSCYICNSTLDNNCQERFNHDSAIAQQKYRDCEMYGAKHCIKATGLWGGIVGSHRFCSSRDLGDQCQDIWFPDHDRMYRACVYTCDNDGCNGATHLSTYPVFVVVGLWLVHRISAYIY